MKVAWLLFGLLLAMCLVVGVLFTVEETEVGHGFTHPQFETMQRGGDGAERHAQVLWGAWLLGILEIAFFVGLIALSVQRRGELGDRRGPLLVGLILYLVTFTFMVVAYHGYANSEPRSLFLSFPIPSAWMIYGIWPVPLYFLFLYVVFFDRWVIGDKDLEKFRRIVEEHRRQEAE